MHDILLVEDDVDIREMIAEVLRAEGYVVEEAANGQEALSKLETRTDRPCLLLLDVMMPVMSGPSLLSALRKSARLSSIPVVAMSAADTVHEVSGVSRFLSKPVLPDEVLAAVREHCQPRDARCWVS